MCSHGCCHVINDNSTSTKLTIKWGLRPKLKNNIKLWTKNLIIKIRKQKIYFLKIGGPKINLSLTKFYLKLILSRQLLISN
jgi:hypothetical protein